MTNPGLKKKNRFKNKVPDFTNLGQSDTLWAQSDIADLTTDWPAMGSREIEGLLCACAVINSDDRLSCAYMKLVVVVTWLNSLIRQFYI